MKRTTVLLGILGAILIVGGGDVRAEIPHLISYQGLLRETAGPIVGDGEYVLTFRIYDVPSEGTALWTEVDSVTVSNGVFDALLGGRTPLDLPFDVPYWLGIAVDPGDEMPERLPITTAAYTYRAEEAQHALVADSARVAGTGAPDSDWIINGDEMYAGVSGNVGIGTDTPTQVLEVRRDQAEATGIRIRNEESEAATYSALSMIAGAGGASVFVGNEEYDGYDGVGKGLHLFQYYANPITLITGRVPRLIVAGNGNVGIGTTNPQCQLEIRHDENSGGGIAVSDASSLIAVLADGGSGDDDGVLKLFHEDETDERVRLYANPDYPSWINAGNVGIGYMEPADKLDVMGDLRVRGGNIKDASGVSRLRIPTSYSTYICDDTGTDRIVITTQGFLGSQIFLDAERVGLFQAGTYFHIQPRSSAPSSPQEGDIYLNSSNHHAYCYLGGTWKQLDN
jgi:hypothetical protein